jgi:enoyl-CoA hydratase/carnithine racemase
VIAVGPLGAGLRRLTISRSAKRNALTRALIEQLTDALLEAEREPSVRGIVVDGEGKSFSAGVDLHEFLRAEDGDALIHALEKLCATVRTMAKPVAAAIHGHCLGGALELVACCDFRVATPDALLGMPEVFLGIPSVIDAVMLSHHVGAGRAHELTLTGEPISGTTAYEWGLVNRLAPQDQLIDTAVALLQAVTRHSPEVIAAQKRVHQRWLNVPYDEAVASSIAPLLEAFERGRPQDLARKRLDR